MAFTANGNNYLMSYPSENSDFQNPSAEQISQLQNKDTDTASVVEINDMRDKIGDKIARAEAEGVINRTDAQKKRLELDKTVKSKSEVSRLDGEVTRLIDESKQLIGSISGKDEKELFKLMSIDEKREYVGNLRKQAKDLNSRADDLARFLPGAKEKLATLEGTERARFIEDLNVRRANIAEYAGKLKEYESHFSKETHKEFMNAFAESPVERQKEWLSMFEEKEGKPRRALTIRYEALPSKYRDRIKDFRQMRRHDKDSQVNKVEEEYQFDRMIDDSGDARYMSVESRDFAKKSFMEAPKQLRAEMKGMLEKHLKKEAELGKRFENLPQKNRARHPNFIELDFEKKEQVLEAEEENGKYEAKLEKEFADGTINKENFNDYMKWFEQQDLPTKKDAGSNEKFMVKEMGWRRKCRDDFRKLPPEVQKANESFYGKKGHDRLDMLEKLLAAEEAKKSGNKAAETAGEGLKETAGEKDMPDSKDVKSGAEGSVQNGNNAPDEAQIRAEIRNAKESGSLIKKRIRDKNIGEGLANLASSSDLINQGIHVSGRKDKHLKNEKERRINQKLVEHTGGKMVADAGHKKARDVHEVDLNKMADGSMTEDELLKLKRDIVDNQGEKAQNVFNIQLSDRQSGQKLTGAMGKEQVRKQEKALHEDIAKRVAANLESRRGIGKEGMKKVQAEVEKDDLKVDLKAA